MIRKSVKRFSEKIMLNQKALVVLGVAVGDSVPVDTLLQDRRRLEHHHTARRNRYFGAGLRIASDTLTLLAHHEGTERRQLHCLALLQTIRDLFQNQFNE